MKNILVALDFSNVTDPLIETACKLAQAFDSDVHLIHVANPEPEFVGYDPGPEMVRMNVAHEFREEHRQIQELEKRFPNPERVNALLIQGMTVEKILQEQERLSTDLIIMGSHGHNAIYRLLVGSVTEGVMRKAACPVLVVPSPGK